MHKHAALPLLSPLFDVRLDISWPLSAMCLVEEIHFYEKLLIVTLGPIIVLGLLGLSYWGAMRWHRGTDRDSVENRRQAKVRHASTALLVLFLVGFLLERRRWYGGGGVRFG